MPQIAPNRIIPVNGGKGEGVSSSSIVPAVTYREPYSQVNQTGDSDPLSGRRKLSDQTFTNGAMPGERGLTPMEGSGIGGVIGPPTTPPVAGGPGDEFGEGINEIQFAQLLHARSRSALLTPQSFEAAQELIEKFIQSIEKEHLSVAETHKDLIRRIFYNNRKSFREDGLEVSDPFLCGDFIMNFINLRLEINAFKFLQKSEIEGFVTLYDTSVGFYETIGEIMNVEAATMPMEDLIPYMKRGLTIIGEYSEKPINKDTSIATYQERIAKARQLFLQDPKREGYNVIDSMVKQIQAEITNPVQSTSLAIIKPYQRPGYIIESGAMLAQRAYQTFFPLTR